jgi:hypothetical protein
MNTLIKTSCALAVAVGTAITAGAQTTIDWFTLDAAGGASSSVNYVINSTAGQNEVGSVLLNSANYRIIPGFWALEDLGPQTGVPVLTITLSGANVILSWPSPSTGFVLQQADTFSILPVAWANTPAAVSDNGFTKSVTIPHNQAHTFYRLRRP